MQPMKNVDIVITWVDGGDPQWQWRKSQFSPGHHSTIENADVKGRFRCNEELRFLLRSIERHWTLSGHIYLVTDQQVPNFIRAHPSLTIVDHRDIIASIYLPVFSSMAIEANLHRIPGLAEHYVVFNDDVFLTRNVSWDDFFGDHGTVVYLSDVALPSDIDKETQADHTGGVNARNWVDTHYGVSHIDFVCEHYPKGIRKSWMMELEAKDPAIFKAVSAARFRDVGTQSIVANLYGHWCLTKGRGQIRYNECVYLESDEIEFNRDFLSLAPIIQDKLCLCINDTTDNRDDVSAFQSKISELLHSLFPTPSRYE